MAKGVGGLILVIVVCTIGIVTTFGIPTLIVLAVLHDGPFARSDSTARLCSKLNVMTNHTATLHGLRTRDEIHSYFEFTYGELSGAQDLPSAISGTVTATTSTSGKLLVLIQTGTNNDGLTNAQQTQFAGLDGVFNHEVSTLNNWYRANC